MLDLLRIFATIQLFVPSEAETLHAFLYLATFGVAGALITALAALVTDKAVQAKSQQMAATLLAPLRKGERSLPRPSAGLSELSETSMSASWRAERAAASAA